MSKNESPPDPKKSRTRGAIAANMRRREEKAAELLVERGWDVASPYENDLRGAEDRAASLLIKRGWTVISPYDNSVRGPDSTIIER